MKTVYWILKRELWGYFRTPIALVFLLAFLFMSVCCTYLWGNFFILDEASLRSYFYWLPYIMVLFVPAVGMRLWCEERRQQTLELLMTMPVTLREIVWGKYLSGLVFLGLGLVLTYPLWLTVELLGDPDYGVLLCGYLGSALLCGAMLSVCSLLSSLTSNQVISYVSGAVCCLFLVLGGHQSSAQLVRGVFGDGSVSSFVCGLSVSGRFETFQRGVIDVGDCLYLSSLSVVFLMGTELILRRRRG